jgi:hypothetical protein
MTWCPAPIGGIWRTCYPEQKPALAHLIGQPDLIHVLCFRRAPQANTILARLDDEGYKRLAPHLELIPLKAKQVLYRAGQQIDNVYFLENAVVCLLTVMQNGHSIACVDVGREGACWILRCPAKRWWPSREMHIG